MSAASLPHAQRGAVERAGLMRRLLREVVATHSIDVTISGDAPTEPTVIVANHLSYLDPIVIGSVLPCLPIAKAEVKRWPFVGSTANALGVIFVTRDDPHSGARAVREAKRVLDAGASVLLFPEGTTTEGWPLDRFKSGAFGLAALAGVPVTTATIGYDTSALAWTGDASFLPHYLGVARRPRLSATVAFGPRLWPRTTKDADGYARLARFLISEQIEQGPSPRLARVA